MNTPLKTALALATLAFAVQASAQVTFYESEQFGGQSFTADSEVRNLKRFGFNDAASSAVVQDGRWEVCDQNRYQGRCRVLRPGSYPSLRAMGMNNRISSVQEISREARIAENRYAPSPQPVAAAGANAVMYQYENFRGATFTATGNVANLNRFGFNDAASSLIVNNAPVEVCSGEGYRGKCVMLPPGRYASLGAMGLNDRVTSMRGVERTADLRRPIQTQTNTGGSVTFYEREGFAGRSFIAEREVGSFQRFGYNDLASSAVVTGAAWELCPEDGFGGRCVVLAPGEYPSLRQVGLDNRVSSVRRRDASSAAAPPTIAPSITFFRDSNFAGPSVTAQQGFNEFRDLGLRGRAQSAEVIGGSWEVCPDRQFGGQCMLLRPGRYPTLASMGLNTQVESARASAINPINASNDPRRDGRGETGRFFEVPVTSVRAVIGNPEQRCWIDKEQAGSNPNVPAAIVGALLGGVLGNQVGGGTGKDIATIGGVVAGAAIGSRIGSGNTDTRDVRRCEEIPAQARTEYWDVTYSFRGQERRVQLNTAPGRTLTVNEAGDVVPS